MIQIERERADLSVQLITLTDRLEDAEGTTDAQVQYKNNRYIFICCFKYCLYFFNLLTSIMKSLFLQFVDKIFRL